MRPQVDDEPCAATSDTPQRDGAANEAQHAAQRDDAGRRAGVPADAGTQLIAAARALGGSKPLAEGLTLLSEARRDLDFAELELIDRARACGQTWQQISEALAVPDRRQAQTRYRRLRERWPEYQPSAPA